MVREEDAWPVAWGGDVENGWWWLKTREEEGSRIMLVTRIRPTVEAVMMVDQKEASSDL